MSSQVARLLREVATIYAVAWRQANVDAIRWVMEKLNSVSKWDILSEFPGLGSSSEQSLYTGDLCDSKLALWKMMSVPQWGDLSLVLALVAIWIKRWGGVILRLNVSHFHKHIPVWGGLFSSVILCVLICITYLCYYFMYAQIFLLFAGSLC